MKRIISQFIVVASDVSSFVEKRSDDTVVSYMLWVILKTSIISPRERLYFDWAGLSRLVYLYTICFFSLVI